MDTQRTAQIVAWTLIGAVVGALVSAFGIFCCRPESLGQPQPSPLFGMLVVFVIFGAFGIPPGLLGGFVMGCCVAPLPSLTQRLIWATGVGAVVGLAYGAGLGTLVNEPQCKSFLLNYGTMAGAVGGFLTPLAVEAVRAAFEK